MTVETENSAAEESSPPSDDTQALLDAMETPPTKSEAVRMMYRAGIIAPSDIKQACREQFGMEVADSQVSSVLGALRRSLESDSPEEQDVPTEESAPEVEEDDDDPAHSETKQSMILRLLKQDLSVREILAESQRLGKPVTSAYVYKVRSQQNQEEPRRAKTPARKAAKPRVVTEAPEAETSIPSLSHTYEPQDWTVEQARDHLRTEDPNLVHLLHAACYRYGAERVAKALDAANAFHMEWLQFVRIQQAG